MKTYTFLCLLAAMCVLSLKAFSQDKGKPKNEAPKEDTTPLLGLAGDNLDLYAVLDIFQKSKTIEEFEKTLNDTKKKINNLDLNLDKKIDFIKVITNKKGDSYQFILRVDISKTESQDVAVILLDKDKDKKISLQIVGDEELYGKDYVIEPKGNSSVTPNPAYQGDNPVTVTVPASTTTVNVVQQAPVVQYVYSPAYVPYVSPYYYGYYPGWWGFATVMAIGIYRSACWGYHGGYYGGHYGGYYGGHNNVIINTGNRNNFNNYNNNKMRSTTVSDNRARGNYGNGAGARNREASMSNRASGGANRQSPGVSNNMRGPSASNRQSSPSVSNRQSSPSVSNRQSASPSTRQSSSGFGSSTNHSSGSSFGGGGRSMGGGGGRSMGGGGGRSMGGGRRG